MDRKSLVAGIVGTGYGFAIYLDDHTIVNVQSADFTGFAPTATGRVVDKESHNVGEQLFNKEVAGGEMFKHYNALINELVLQGGQLRTGQELAALAASNANKEGDAAQALLQRSASLVATQFAGFYNFRRQAC